MHDMPDNAVAQGAQPFGTYSPNRWQARVLQLTRRMPDSWLGRRIAYGLRRAVTMTLRTPLDVEVFGQRMRLSPFNNVSEKRILFTPQYFDAAERALLAERLRSDAVFVDIGANIGAYALFVAGLADSAARILAVEPQPTIFERLVYNIAQNPAAPIRAFPIALADRDGKITLFVDSYNRGESSVKILGRATETGQSVEVPARTLLTLAEEEGLERIDILKIDIEGAEDLVLAPFLRDAPDRLLPALVIIENARMRWQTDCVALLEATGYRILAETRLNFVLERNADRA